MKIRLTLEIDDEQRQIIASKLAGKTVQRYATRAEVRKLLVGLLARYCNMPCSETVRVFDEHVEPPAERSRKLIERATDALCRQSATAQQLATAETFKFLNYKCVGFMDKDLIIETPGEKSPIRQRITPRGDCFTLRSGSTADMTRASA